MGITISCERVSAHGQYRYRYRPTVPIRAIAAAAALLLSSGAYAAEWTFVPAVGAGETYTDNVNLTSGATRQSDFVTQITPSILINARGPNLTFDSYFGLNQLHYARGAAGDQLQKQVNANGHARLIDNLLYIDARGSISQQNISAFGAQPTGTLNGTNNQTTVTTYHVSPYLRHAFDNIAISEFRVAHDSVSADAGGLSNAKTDTVSFSTNSGKAFRTVGWGVQYNDQTIRYPSQDKVTLENTNGTLSYLVTPKVKLIGTVGYDNNVYSAINNTSKGYSWTTGFEWTVSQRTNLSASFGRHYYGNSVALSAATRTRTANWVLNYNESVTTTPSQFTLPGSIDTVGYLNSLLSGTISDPAQRTLAINQIIRDSGLPGSLANSVNYFTNTTFLEKSLTASAVFTSPRSTLLFALFDTRREPLSTQQSTSILLGDSKTDQYGANAVFTRRLSTRTTATLSLLAQRVQSVTLGRTDDFQSARISMSRQMSRQLRGTVEIRRNQGQSNQPGVGYRENAISAFFNYQL